MEFNKRCGRRKYFGIEFKLVSCDGLDFKLLKIQ